MKQPSKTKANPNVKHWLKLEPAKDTSRNAKIAEKIRNALHEKEVDADNEGGTNSPDYAT